MEITAHPAVPRAELGAHERAYLPTYAFGEAYIDEGHARLAQLPRDGQCIKASIPGWLQQADALKLYELAYFSGGDILELGTYCGLATSIMCDAVAASGGGKAITSVDLSRWHHWRAKVYLASRRARQPLTLIRSDATRQLDHFIKKNQRFGFVFIDHSHAYGPMRDTCQRLSAVTASAGWCLFHDYNDARNLQQSGADHEKYGVAAAIHDSLDIEAFECYGVFGACILFRRKDTPCSP